MIYEKAKLGYANLWKRAELLPHRRAIAHAIAKKLAANRLRYEKIAAEIGCPWWWIAITHNLESGGNFNTYLGNGQALNRVTTIVPKGRGPFASFEAGAIDALRLKRLNDVRSWEVERCLFEFERYNGFGYVARRINSPYVWSFTTLYERGKYVRDGIFDASAVSEQCGAAAIMKAFIEIGAVSFEKENDMSELSNTLAPFAALVPHLVRAVAGPLPSLALRALAEALDTEPQPAPVKQKLEETPLSELMQRLQKAEDTIQAIAPQASLPPVYAGAEPSPVAVAPVPAAVPVVVVPVEAPSLAIDRFLPKGWKTIVGIVIYCAGIVLPIADVVTPETGTVIQTVGGGLIGVTVKLMLDRWLPLFAGFLRPQRSGVANEVVTR